MIYISAQPDDYYFTWQLEIQLRNFQELKISPDEIHVLIAYDPKIGLKSRFKDFIESNNRYAKFFIYPDNRTNRIYLSSIRPHLLRQHFFTFPELAKEIIFYHDSDILLSRVPHIKDLKHHQTCYVSDTRNYLDSRYIKAATSEGFLNIMAETVGVATEKICENDHNCGGAQYVLKNVDYMFWEKVEGDCERLYSLMKAYNNNCNAQAYMTPEGLKNAKNGIQAWCADMWAVLWNLWYFNREVKIHSELNFSWPNSPIARWSEDPILHYSGDQKNKEIYFAKTSYINFPPWYDYGLKSIPDTNCSFPIVQAIFSRRDELDRMRTPFEHIVFILTVTTLDEESSEAINTTQKYLHKYFSCSVKVFVHGDPEDYAEKQFNNIEIICGGISEESLKIWKGSYLAFYPAGYVIAINQIKAIINQLKNGKSDILKLQSQSCYHVDPIFTKAFSLMLDEELLYSNINKFSLGPRETDQFLFIAPDSTLLGENNSKFIPAETIKKIGKESDSIKEIIPFKLIASAKKEGISI